MRRYGSRRYVPGSMFCCSAMLLCLMIGLHCPPVTQLLNQAALLWTLLVLLPPVIAFFIFRMIEQRIKERFPDQNNAKLVCAAVDCGAFGLAALVSFFLSM